MLTAELPPSTETGKLQVMHLKRYWCKAMLERNGIVIAGGFQDEWKTDNILLHSLGLGLEQTFKYLFISSPSFEQFENWIVEVAGEPDRETVNRFNRLLTGEIDKSGEALPDVLSNDDLNFWDKNGYVIVRQAVPQENCDKSIELLCNYIGVDRYDPGTWYGNHSARQGIMVQLFQHPVLNENRRSAKIRKAFEQLWNRTDIWVNTDRVGFNPPETKTYQFQGPRLHWDVSIHQPIPFGTQGILYLSDTAENQGAFTLVPGFQNEVGNWLSSLPPGANPREQNLYALGPKPIAANAGDFIIWHEALPHGSSPNTASVPRFVQYINYEPADKVDSSIWI